MPEPQLLAIDVGTQSARAIVFDLAGNIVGKAQIPIEPYFSAQPGWAEQEPQLYWRSVAQACGELWNKHKLDPASIAGVALTTQRATVVNLDARGQPLRPAIIWLDQRRAHGVPPVGGAWGLAFKLAGVTSTIKDFQSKAQANWIVQNQPQIWAETKKFLLLSGYLNQQLTGRFVDSSASQVGYVPFDFKHLRWAGARDWKWQALPIKRDQLPDLVPPSGRLGELAHDAARTLGLRAGLPVISAGADKACEVLGAGCLEPQQGCLSFGTTATINTTTRKYLEVIPHIPPYPAAVPEAYNTEIQIFRGFWMVSWFKEQFAHRESSLAAEQGLPTEALFDKLVEQVPPGSMGLTLQPYWSPGVREPGPEAKGSVIGFGDVHTRAHLYRSIIEGLVYALRAAREKIEARSKTPITILRVAGGGSQSDAAMQISADIFNLPAQRAHIYETSALGAAINAAVGLGLHRDYSAALGAMTRPGKTFTPNPESSRIYQELYTRVYQRMYKQLQPLYKEIRDITGYPPP
ncbi:MAG: FGGY-family carbohydrate kinase [Nevskiales bacterium]